VNLNSVSERSHSLTQFNQYT